MSVETQPHSPNRLIRIALPLLLIVSIGTFLAALYFPVPWLNNNELKPQDEGFVVPDFALTERNGDTVTRDDLQGRVWVAAFIFTNCSGPCPKVTATMARLQKELNLAEEPNLRFVTFTIDPKRDTPEVLQEYAKRFRADDKHWLFLTGDEKTIHKLSKDGFVLLSERSKEANPPLGQEFDHATKLAVVDKDGNIRDYFDGFQTDSDTDGSVYEDELARLRKTVKALLNE